jgi:hypothetical protein
MRDRIPKPRCDTADRTFALRLELFAERLEFLDLEADAIEHATARRRLH